MPSDGAVRRRIRSLKTSKKISGVMSRMNPFKKLMKIKRKNERTAVKRRVKDSEGIPDNELVMKADKRLSR